MALKALAATLGDERRAQRLLDLTGIDPAALRARAADPVLLGEVLDFLAAYEPDLIAVAAQIGIAPGELIAARRRLAEGGD